jgi:glucose/arabinose dehydrogenase
VAEAMTVPAPPRSVFSHAVVATMQRAAAVGESPNRITLLRDADGDGVAETHEALLENLNQPFGMALLGDTFYVGNTDGVLAFPYSVGATRIGASGRRLATFKPGGHWTRSLLPSTDGRKIYVGVGSLSNIAETGFEPEQGRACIYEIDLASDSSRIFASGLRNPVGMAWEPNTGVLWTVVNERDGLGDETPPDYALGGHTASLGLCWMPAGTLPGYPDGMAIGQHGSWNRSTLSGYKVVFVPFANGRPSGAPRDILSGFLAPDERESYGRPVGVAIGPDRASLLVADDVGNVIWRVAAA